MRSRSSGKTLRMFLGLITVLALNANAQANTITFAYEGIVNLTERGGAAFDAFLGETLRIVYTFDTTETDSNSNPGIGTYALQSLSFTLGSDIYQADPSQSQIDVNIITAGGYYDVGTLYGALSGASIGGALPSLGILRLWNDGPSIFIDDSLPLVQPDPQLFDDNIQNPNHSFLQLQFVDSNSGEVTGIISVDGSNNIIIDSDGDGIPDANDLCTQSNLAVAITGTCDSGVANPLQPSGCTLADLFSDCGGNPNKVNRCIDKVADKLKNLGIITRAQADDISICLP